MTEYWVSKKQYWCKYCSIWIRDDAPSKKHHETGLKHIGNRERFIRDLYKSGNKAKADKAEAAAELAKIEAAALRSGDTATRLSLLESLRAQRSAAEHSARQASRPKDKFADYTSAQDLGLAEPEAATVEESYVVEQELKGRAADVGAWEEVDHAPTGYYTAPEAGPSTGYKRKIGEYGVKDDDDHEEYDIRRRKRDPYDDEDWDLPTIKGKARIKEEVKEEHARATNLDRSAWTGKLDLAIKAEVKPADPENDTTPEPPADIKPEPLAPAAPAPDAKPDAATLDKPASLFKKRRPPPSSRKL